MARLAALQHLSSQTGIWCAGSHTSTARVPLRPTQRSADSFAADLWKLQRQLLPVGRGLRPFQSSPTSRSFDRPKRAPGAALPRNGAKRLIQTRGPAGQVPPRTALCCSDPLPSCYMQEDAVHAHSSVLLHVITRFTSWVSTRHSIGLERRTGTAARNTSVQCNKHYCMLFAACCMVHVACFRRMFDKCVS